MLMHANCLSRIIFNTRLQEHIQIHLFDYTTVTACLFL